MPPPNVKPVDTIEDYIREIRSLQAGTPDPLWFRGIGSATYRLTPTLFRHSSITDPAALADLEKKLLTRFKHRSIPFQTRQSRDDWELFFLMQHFGVPTRLLDWSENPFVALYFAITSAETRMSGAAFSGPAAVWVLNTKLWNQSVLSPFYGGRILTLPDAFLDGYAPGHERMPLHAKPVAMAGIYNSERIVAQRGAFTIFGHINEPMESIFDTQSFPVDSLLKIELPTAHLADLRQALFSLGYADSMMYPDLGGLAKEMKREFGFGV